MAVDPNPDAEGSQAVAALIDAAAALPGRPRDIPKSFMVALFARAVPEDFLSYQAREIAACLGTGQSKRGPVNGLPS